MITIAIVPAMVLATVARVKLICALNDIRRRNKMRKRNDLLMIYIVVNYERRQIDLGDWHANDGRRARGFVTASSMKENRYYFEDNVLHRGFS